MTLLSALTLLTLTIPGGTPAWTAADVLDEVGARYRQGAIDEGELHLYRVALVKDRDLLPDDLRALAEAAEPSPRRCLTPVFQEAWRWIEDNDAQGSVLHELLLPPDDLPNVLDSSSWPIRVSYDGPNDESLAQWVLYAAEISWAVQINQYGFYEPAIEPGTERYRFYILPTTGSAAAYTARYADNPGTPWTDCFTYIVVDPGEPEWSVEGTVAHEVNHSLVAAMDCFEPAVFWENTATYIMSRVFPQQIDYTLVTMQYFQSQPWRALDYMNRFQTDLYEYGGGLFAWYLADTFAPNDGPQFLGEIWQAAIQTEAYNEPDYFDAIEDAAAARGAAVTMEDILVDFSEARFFVGSWDDGAHISGANGFWNAEVGLAALHDLSDLPLVREQVDEERRPAPFGSNHIRVDLPSGYSHPLRVSFDGADDTRWSVRLLRLGNGPAFSNDLALDPDTWDGTMLVEPGGADALLLLVVNRGDEGYDPDDRSWPVSAYTYSVEPILAPPTVEAIVPAVVERGTQAMTLQLLGTGFAQGPEFDVTLDDEAIQISGNHGIQPTVVTFTVTIPLLTELGPKTITLTNGDGQRAVGVDFLTVVEHGSLDPGGDAGPGTDEPRTGCGCATDGDAPGPLLALLVLGLLGLAARRRSGRRR